MFSTQETFCFFTNQGIFTGRNLHPKAAGFPTIVKDNLSTKFQALHTIAHQPRPWGYLDLGRYLAQEINPDGCQLRYK